MDEGTPTFLRVDRLTKTYRGGWGLHEVTFTLPRGMIVALDGPNGSGKSTLLRCLAGLAQHQGTIALDDEPLTARSDARGSVGYLPQSVAFPERASVAEVIELFARLRRTGSDDHPLPDGFLPDGDALIGELSGGQRHRVAVTVALLGHPGLLLLDEPVAGLDEAARGTFWSVLRRLRDARDVTSIVSSPSPSELRGVADRALHLDDGHLLGEGALNPVVPLPVRPEGTMEAFG
jgi:ABC-type multidrug transport system ATPase subunit